jgi:hypothetical protein
LCLVFDRVAQKGAIATHISTAIAGIDIAAVESSAFIRIRKQGGTDQMNDLAFNVNGDAFDVPASVAAWRVRRLKPRGAPELVYARDGRPLTLSVESDVDDLRDAVNTSGKYRLDPINEDGRCVEGVPAAYIQITKGERNADMSSERSHDTRSDGALAGLSQAIVEAVKLNAEALRQNAEISRCAIDRLPQLMDAMTTMLHVATGAGLHAIQQRDLAYDDAESEPRASVQSTIATGIDINVILGQGLAQLTESIMKKMPSLGGILDPRKAYAEGQKERHTKQLGSGHLQSQPTTQPIPTTGSMSATTPTSTAQHDTSSDSVTAMHTDAGTLLHFAAIQNALTPTERELAGAIAQELTIEQRAAWLGELKAMAVPDAVTRIRTMLVQLAQNAPPTVDAHAQATPITPATAQTGAAS